MNSDSRSLCKKLQQLSTAALICLTACGSWADTANSDLPKSVIPAPRTIEYSWMSVATWQQKHADDVAVAEKGGVDLLFVGDSITDGWNDEVWQEYFAKYNPANFGIGGDHTANVLWRLQHGDVGNLHPKAIVLLIGVNNFGHLNETPEKVFPGVKAVVQQLRLAFPTAKILLNAVFPYEHPADSPKRAEVKQLNKMIATLDDNKYVFFKDYGHLFLEKDGSISKEIMGDYLHPTRKGDEIWAKAMMPTLKAWLD